MDLGLSGKTALLAGASAGMGKEAARALAREGVSLVISARGADRLHATAQEIAGESGVSVVPVVADHGTAEGRAALLAACPAPDILIVTCSPPRATTGYRDVEAAEWMETLEATLVGPIELARLVLDGMAERKFGRIVNIGTGAAKNPHEMRLLSGPARAALANWQVAVSKRLIRDNVTINSVLPGMFDTPGSRDMLEARAAKRGTSFEEEKRHFIDTIGIPAGRFGDPADVGAFCAMLCGRYASFVTGQSIIIDGGLINAVF
ncbi:SDR family oxidoreductase [Sphingomonas radiodurans]|uniref:SDR family oxidoreductase n=1 Tax=Sphingomonas radiodurans TaxID=2890321 RepID=UPI001E58326C|nr:SDR family oxidoreductase [Sphingomonas radiodurans]WBH17796.1 SDR family oxidoreductase [Sphingomonas radiodurans]